MLRLIDTHSHIYEPEFDDDRNEVVERAIAAGVDRMLLPAIDTQSHSRMIELTKAHPANCFAMMGLHPTSVNENPTWRNELAEVEEYLRQPPEGVRFYAVGEIGLDYYWSQEYIEDQREAFVYQLRLAAELDLPVAIHTRSAWEDMCTIVEREAAAAHERGQRLYGVFHAFSENAATYRRLRACGDFLFGIGGVVTFKKSALAETVRDIAPEDLLLETDCPYLTPVPYRGKRNESSYIPYICARVAELTNCSVEDLAAITTRNAERIFGLK
ncbi:MAG: TatD family hydrolase [Rikenellaceae bacterium]|nr:TatD family hydrolase [Rikenellaceae bacterium]